MPISKRDFGSFHASNVEELIELEESDYQAPGIPIPLPDFTNLENVPFPFGHTCRSSHFFLDDSCTFLNHGAFGGVLKHGLEAAQAWQRYVESQPLRFFDRQLLPLLVEVTKRMANFVGCSARDLLLIPNVTTGINCILRSLDLKADDVVYHLSVEYGAVKKIVQQVCKEFGATVQEETLQFPLKDEKQILDLVSGTLKENTRLAVFDFIPSNTPFVLPVQKLAKLCHERNVEVLIDGAHSLGQVPVDVSSLGVDYFLSNCHKWLCAPKGTAVMYVADQHHARIRPLVISHGYLSGFHSQFIWTGLQDYSGFLALPTVIDFWRSVGVENILDRNKQLADEAASLLVKAWDSGLLAPSAMTGSMVCVRLPASLYSHKDPLTYDAAEVVQNALYHQHNIEVPIKCIQGHLYVRISVHIYNDKEQYVILGNAIEELTEKNILKED